VKAKARAKVVPWPAKRAPAVSLATLASGYRLTASGPSAGEQDLITLTAPDGRVCLSVALRPDGPVVQVHAQSLAVTSDGVLRLDCDRLEIQAPGGTSLRTGSLEQEIAGDLRTRAGGVIESEAHAQRMHARRGDVALSANDDVTLDGERVRLNSPREATPIRPGAPLPLAAVLGPAIDCSGRPDRPAYSGRPDRPAHSGRPDRPARGRPPSRKRSTPRR
jgi:hypothetical protein